MADSKMTVNLSLDTSDISRKLRIIAKHAAALADELEMPDQIITFRNGELAEEDIARIRERFAEAQRTERPEAL